MKHLSNQELSVTLSEIQKCSYFCS